MAIPFLLTNFANINMQKPFIVLILTIFFTSCGIHEEKEQAPTDILDQAVMQEILWDVNMAEVQLQKRIDLNSNEINAKRKEDLKEILDERNVQDSMFSKSYKYYASQPNIFKQMLEANLEKAKKEIEVLENDRDTSAGAY